MSLSKIQAELKAPKSQFHSFGKYKYRSLEDITEAIKPLLEKYKAILTMSDDIQIVGERVYVKATVTIKVDGEDAVSTTAFAREPLNKKGMDESQITGMASSYARKYALNGLLAIDDTKDADSMDNSKENRPTASKASNEDKKRLWEEFAGVCEMLDVDPKDFLASQVDMNDKNAVHNLVNKWIKSGQALQDQLIIFKGE